MVVWRCGAGSGAARSPSRRRRHLGILGSSTNTADTAAGPRLTFLPGGEWSTGSLARGRQGRQGAGGPGQGQGRGVEGGGEGDVAAAVPAGGRVSGAARPGHGGPRGAPALWPRLQALQVGSGPGLRRASPGGRVAAPAGGAPRRGGPGGAGRGGTRGRARGRVSWTHRPGSGTLSTGPPRPGRGGAGRGRAPHSTLPAWPGHTPNTRHCHHGGSRGQCVPRAALTNLSEAPHSLSPPLCR